MGMVAGGTLATLAKATQTQSSADWDYVVIGAGVFGAWTAWHLQHGGARVLLVDAWGAGHSRSSSGGETRLIRTEYDGDELYTTMAWDSLQQWRALSQRHEQSLFHEVGALYLYSSVSAPVERSVALNRSLGIPIETLSAADIAKRWPQFKLEGIASGVFQPSMGALMARRGVQTVVREFSAAGGAYKQASVVPVDEGSDRVEAVRTEDGATLRARAFVFACGPWLPKLFPKAVGARIVPTRQEVFFFAPPKGDSRFAGTRLPAWVDTTSPDLHYGFPDIESRGFKIALDAHGPTMDPESGDRRISDRGLADVRKFLERRFPALAQRPLAESRVCQYENTSSGEFLIDRHPRCSNLWIVGGGSGHGFKHGPAVGQYVAQQLAGSRAAEPRFTFAGHDAASSQG